MKVHTRSGKRVFIKKASDYDDDAMEVALNHHKRWDGTGYSGYVDNPHPPIPGKVELSFRL